MANIIFHSLDKKYICLPMSFWCKIPNNSKITMAQKNISCSGYMRDIDQLWLQWTLLGFIYLNPGPILNEQPLTRVGFPHGEGRSKREKINHIQSCWELAYILLLTFIVQSNMSCHVLVMAKHKAGRSIQHTQKHGKGKED